MLNIERLAYLLLTRSLPGVTVVPDLDVDSIDRFPLVTFTVTGGQALDLSGPKPAGWLATLSLTVFDDDMDDAIDLAGQVYDAVWSWNDPWAGLGAIDGVGHVADVDDSAVFTRVNTAQIGALSVTQMAGEFSFQAHQA